MYSAGLALEAAGTATAEGRIRFRNVSVKASVGRVGQPSATNSFSVRLAVLCLRRQKCTV
jgi:hypothetical protein